MACRTYSSNTTVGGHLPISSNRRSIALFVMVVMAALFLTSGCDADTSGAPKPSNRDLSQTTAMTSIATLLAQNANRLLGIPGIEGVAEGLCQQDNGNEIPCIRIFLSVPVETVETEVAAILQDAPYRYEATGGFNATPES